MTFDFAPGATELGGRVFLPGEDAGGPTSALVRGRALERIFELVRLRRGLDLHAYRAPTILGRMRARMGELGAPDHEAYLDILIDDPGEVDVLMDRLVIQVSSFFREPIAFEALAHTILFELVQLRGSARDPHLSVWSAGCASGEELYSIAILLRDLLGADADRWNLTLCGTDIDPSMLRAAHEGVYDEAALGKVRLEWVNQHFSRVGERYVIEPELRRGVYWSVHDLTVDPVPVPAGSVFEGFDLILCRNVLIYLRAEVQARVLETLAAGLDSGGGLVLGMAEALPPGLTAELETVDARTRIFRKR